MSDLIHITAIENTVDTVFDHLMDEASYLANSEETDKRYAPDPALLDLLAWNVVVAFWVNIAASYFYDYFLQRRPKKLESENEKLKQEIMRLQMELSSNEARLSSKEECIKILGETNQMLKSINASPTIIKSMNVNSVEVTELLKTWGWPGSAAKSKAEILATTIHGTE